MTISYGTECHSLTAPTGHNPFCDDGHTVLPGIVPGSQLNSPAGLDLIGP